jgi:7,8-didemethyl-8-hydroxy-5-deazariboflavin synthase CofG subunit
MTGRVLGTTLDKALDAAAAGQRLSADDAEALLGANDSELETILELASELRSRGLAAIGRPNIITYSRKVFIPLTTLCRDRCHYCIFVDTPNQLLKMHKPLYMSPEQVLIVARQGAELGCKEALLTLGDRPEDRWPEARSWLDAHGYTSTLDYVGAMARLITAETGMLAHLNPGVMSAEELRTLRPVAPSMGMMLETTSRELFEIPGEAHYGSPDKDPSIRLRVIEDAGAARIPFTTGVLIGIGETIRDRAESLVALREISDKYGHVQEVIIQNFRAKPQSAMQGVPDASTREYVAAVAVARLVMGAAMRVQVPPNLSDPREFELLVKAGADDWGGVSPLTADHVNPERPWPHLDELANLTAKFGFDLRERLTAHPEYLSDPDQWLDPAMVQPTMALSDPSSFLARMSLDGSVLRPTGVTASPIPPRRQPTLNSSIRLTPSAKRAAGFRNTLARASSAPGELEDAEWETLLLATGDSLEKVVETADDVRRYTVGEAITIVINRNISSSAFRPSRGVADASYDATQLAEMVQDAWELGATEICMQGLIAPDVDPLAYLELPAIVKQAAPGIHLHAFRPQDVVDFAERAHLTLPQAIDALHVGGVDTIPGTGVKILSERVRRLIAPGDLEIDTWIETITAAHQAGLKSSSVLFYGHHETALERISHLRTLVAIQQSTKGFTELVPIPLPGFGVPLVADRSQLDEHRVMFAVARLMLSGVIPHIQVPWTRLGIEDSAAMLRAGADDLGGTLLDGRVLPGFGVEVGLELSLPTAQGIARSMFRPLRQRTTSYGDAPSNRPLQ